MGLIGNIVDTIGNVGRSVASTVTFSDSYPGEKHLMMKNKYGLPRMGNYTGPGTALIKRLKKGSKPISATDRASKAHDIRYSLALTGKDVRKADMKMRKKVKKIARSGQDHVFNTTAVRAIMGSKNGLESMGLLDQKSFIANNKKVTPQDRRLYMKHLRKLEKAGY